MDPIFTSIARRCFSFVERQTRLPAIICDASGTVIEAADRSRVGKKEGAAERIVRGEAAELAVDEGGECHVAIDIDGQRLGTFGVSAPVTVSRPVARVAAAVVASWMKEHRRREALGTAAREVYARVKDISSRIGGATTDAAALSEQMTRTSAMAKRELAKIAEGLAGVQEIALKGRIISSTGAVEAALVTADGGGFGFVARDMRALSEEARQATINIEGQLREVRQAMVQLADAIGRSATLTPTLSGALAEIVAVVEDLHRAVVALASDDDRATRRQLPSSADRRGRSRGGAASDPMFRKVTHTFLDFVVSRTELPIIVCDETGTIIDAAVRSRIGSVHAGAQQIMRGETDEVFVTAEDVARDPRMKEGCNVVIDVDGERLGTFGIAGKAEVTQPLARIAAAVVVAWLQEERHLAVLKEAATKVLEGVSHVSERSATIGAEAAQVTTLMTSSAREASAAVAKSGEIIAQVQDIAESSRGLAINGSIEATRAGAQGRAFAVVAQEMLVLAEDARRTADQTARALGEVQRGITDLAQATAQATELVGVQTRGLGEIADAAQGLKQAVMQVSG